MDDHQFRQLLHHLGFSWKGYRRIRKGVKKRIRRHMQQLGCKDLSVYLLELDKSEKARRQCERMMTVSISRFFRDRKLWDILEKEILPQLIQGHRDKVEIWFAGCASSGCFLKWSAQGPTFLVVRESDSWARFLEENAARGPRGRLVVRRPFRLPERSGSL